MNFLPCFEHIDLKVVQRKLKNGFWISPEIERKAHGTPDLPFTMTFCSAMMHTHLLHAGNFLFSIYFFSYYFPCMNLSPDTYSPAIVTFIHIIFFVRSLSVWHTLQCTLQYIDISVLFTFRMEMFAEDNSIVYRLRFEQKLQKPNPS